MAEALNSYDDLDELCEVDDDLTITFNKAAKHLEKLLPKVDNKILLELYGLYKQGTVGRCNTPRPGWLDLKGKAKWDHWDELSDLPKNEAKKLYIDKIKRLDETFCPDDPTNSDQPKEGWVTVSTLQKPTDYITDKTINDYIKENDVDEINRLIKRVNLNALDTNGLAPIHWAADQGNLNILDILIKNGSDVNLPDNEGQTALHYCSSCGYPDCVKLLLQEGADRNAADNQGDTALSVALDKEICALLS